MSTAVSLHPRWWAEFVVRGRSQKKRGGRVKQWHVIVGGVNHWEGNHPGRHCTAETSARTPRPLDRAGWRHHRPNCAWVVGGGSLKPRPAWRPLVANEPLVRFKRPWRFRRRRGNAVHLGCRNKTPRWHNQRTHKFPITHRTRGTRQRAPPPRNTTKKTHSQTQRARRSLRNLKTTRRRTKRNTHKHESHTQLKLNQTHRKRLRTSVRPRKRTHPYPPRLNRLAVSQKPHPLFHPRKAHSCRSNLSRHLQSFWLAQRRNLNRKPRPLPQNRNLRQKQTLRTPNHLQKMRSHNATAHPVFYTDSCIM